MKAVSVKQFTLLAATCALTGSVWAAGDPPVAHHPSLKLSTGVFHCDLNRRVEVRQVADDRRSAIVYWERRNYTMQLVATQTGALRMEDKASGLTWITIPGKSMLLDTKHGKQLANDCRA